MHSCGKPLPEGVRGALGISLASCPGVVVLSTEKKLFLPFHGPDNLSQENPAGVPCKDVPAARSFAAPNDIHLFQAVKQLFKVGMGDSLPPSNVRKPDRLSFLRVLGKIQQGPDRVA